MTLFSWMNSLEYVYVNRVWTNMHKSCNWLAGTCIESQGSNSSLFTFHGSDSIKSTMTLTISGQTAPLHCKYGHNSPYLLRKLILWSVHDCPQTVLWLWHEPSSVQWHHSSRPEETEQSVKEGQLCPGVLCELSRGRGREKTDGQIVLLRDTLSVILTLCAYSLILLCDVLCYRSVFILF